MLLCLKVTKPTPDCRSKRRIQQTRKGYLAVLKGGMELVRAASGVLLREGICLGLPSTDKETAIRAAGALLAQLGYVDETYADAMMERENITTTYMGMGVAIPHGTSQKKETVKKSGIVVMQYPEGVDFGGEKAYLVFGIAGVGDEHLNLLANVCDVLEDEEALQTMKTTSDVEYLLKKLN